MHQAFHDPLTGLPNRCTVPRSAEPGARPSRGARTRSRGHAARSRQLQARQRQPRASRRRSASERDRGQAVEDDARQRHRCPAGRRRVRVRDRVVSERPRAGRGGREDRLRRSRSRLRRRAGAQQVSGQHRHRARQPGRQPSTSFFATPTRRCTRRRRRGGARSSSSTRPCGAACCRELDVKNALSRCAPRRPARHPLPADRVARHRRSALGGGARTLAAPSVGLGIADRVHPSRRSGRTDRRPRQERSQRDDPAGGPLVRPGPGAVAARSLGERLPASARRSRLHRLPHRHAPRPRIAAAAARDRGDGAGVHRRAGRAVIRYPRPSWLGSESGSASTTSAPATRRSHPSSASRSRR